MKLCCWVCSCGLCCSSGAFCGIHFCFVLKIDYKYRAHRVADYYSQSLIDMSLFQGDLYAIVGACCVCICSLPTGLLPFP